MATEYRVAWKRAELRPKTRVYKTRRAAERFSMFFGEAPWAPLGKDPDALWCCYGHECNCEGRTVREHFLNERKAMPALEYLRIEERTVGPWRPVERESVAWEGREESSPAPSEGEHPHA